MVARFVALSVSLILDAHDQGGDNSVFVDKVEVLDFGISGR